MRIKYRFNMIEIALAIAVLVVGISGILTLFPVGVNAGKEAMNENLLADASSYILGYYRSLIMHDIYHTDGSTFSSWSTAIGTTPPAESAVENTVKWTSAPIDGTHLYRRTSGSNTPDASLLNKVFLYRQTFKDSDGSEQTENEIAARVWCASTFPLRYRELGDTVKSGDVASEPASISPSDNYALRVYLELSWPFELPYADREKRIYVMDLANPTRTLR